MFIFNLHFIKPIEEVDQAVPAHMAYLEKFYQCNKFICSGGKNPRTGGIIVCNAKDLAEAQAIQEEDPFYIQKLAQYEIIEFIPTKCSDELKSFM